MKNYSELELLIERIGRKYRARVLRAPVGDASADFAPPFSSEELESLVPLLAGTLRDVELRRAQSAQKLLREAGTKLFQAVFRGQVLTCLGRSRDKAAAQGEGLRIRLRLTRPELALWPWEYLYDPERYGWLALLPDLAIVRYPEVGEVISPLLVKPPLRVLVVTAGKTGGRPLNVEREWSHIKHGLGKVCRWRRVILERLENGTLPELHERLGRAPYHVLHFIGHGSHGPDGGALVLEGSHGGPNRVGGRTLGSLLHSHSSLRLVVLNSCEGAKEGEAEVFSSVAETLVRNKIPAVVAMRAAVSDDAATSFASHFYRRLAQGEPLEDVITRTRRGMLADEYGVEWGTPVLYLRAASGRLFDLVRPRFVYGLAAAILLFLVLFLWAVSFLILPRSSTLANTETDPRCPMPRDLHMPFKLIEPGPTENGESLKSFCLTAFEITQGQWKNVMGREHESSYRGPDRPVEKTSLQEAREFAKTLNRRDSNGRYRLPRDLEWGYAADEGRSKLDATVLPMYGNCWSRKDDDEGTALVGRYRPNRFNLYDMIGNVQEWVDDGAPPGEGIVRGGSWKSPLKNCGPKARQKLSSTSQNYQTGFRIVRDPLPAPPK